MKAEDANVTKDVQEQIEEESEDSLIVVNTKNNNVTVPNVTGQSASSAQSALTGAELKYTVSYKSSDTVSDGVVISQTNSGGSTVLKGSTVGLVVCNNSTKTQYRSRTISEETTTDSANTKSGWALYDTTYSWSDYGEWSSWTTDSYGNSDTRNVETKNQYRFYDKTSNTSNGSPNTSMAGCTYTGVSNITGSTYGAQTKGSSLPSGAKKISTQYTYYHYCSYYNNKWNVDSISVKNTNSKKHSCTTSSPLKATPNLVKDKGGKAGSECGGEGNGAPACEYNFYVWWLGSTTYTYQPKINIYTSYFWKAPSAWTDGNASGNTDNRMYEGRILYRYRDRSQIATYHFKRNVYGNWSEWNDKQQTNSDTLEVQTREVKVY